MKGSLFLFSAGCVAFSSAQSLLVISEVVAKSEDASGSSLSDWVELHNPGATAQSTAGMYIWDDKPNEKALVSVDVAPGAYYVVEIEKLGSSDSVELYNSDGILASSTSWKTGEAPLGFSWSRCSDPADGSVYWSSAAVTREAANDCSLVPRVPQSGYVVISEIKNLNTTLADQDDWVELYNPGTEDAVMNGWTMSDEVKAYVNRYIFPTDLVIAAGEYHIITLDTDSPFRLGASDEVHLFDGMATEVDEAHWSNGWFLLGNTLVRCPLVDDDYTFQLAAGEGTPGAANVCVDAVTTPSVVINEVMGNGTEWIEFYNKGSSAIAVAQWRFSDKDYHFQNRERVGKTPDGLNDKIMQPGEYHVVDMGPKDFGFDISGDEKVYLFDDRGVLQQVIGWESWEAPLAGTSFALCDGEYSATSVLTKGDVNECVEVADRDPVAGTGSEAGDGTPGGDGTEQSSGSAVRPGFMLVGLLAGLSAL